MIEDDNAITLNAFLQTYYIYEKEGFKEPFPKISQKYFIWISMQNKKKPKRKIAL